VTETWTIKKLVDWTTEYLKKYSIEWPHLEAEILLAHSLKIPRIQLYVQFERVLTPDELAEYKKLLLRRTKREPIAYITGKQPFMSLDFEVNPSVLIPRPETEKLVEITIDLAKKLENPAIADIGTGSGAIAVSLAKYIPSAKVRATDSSKEAIEAAKSNAEKHGVQDRCEFFVGDLLNPLKGEFDIIVSNPPYIKTGEIDSLQPEISKFEPRYALDGGDDGLNYYRKIVEEVAAYLKGNGSLVLEVGAGQAKTVNELIGKTGKFAAPEIIKDLSGIERVVVAHRS
jgi:release factor glutamine methyltransferase